MGVTAMGGRIAELPIGVHGSTFGGNPLACAAGLAALDIVQKEELVGRAAETGAYFIEQLRTIESPLIRDVRGMGLMIGIDLRIRAMPVVHALLDSGVLVLTSGKTVIRLLPPLTISRSEIDRVVCALQEILLEMELPVPAVSDGD
jgi:acetylornithine/LysW-gamma-L-lysine aminotransferase